MAPLRVGSLTYTYQAIDSIGPLDVLGSSDGRYFEILKKFGPLDETAVKNAPPEVAFHHIGLSRDPVPLSAGIFLVPTCTTEDAPELDILILPGPDPSDFDLDPRFADFIRKHVASGKTLFTNCTGAAVAAMTGVLDGKKATINHSCYGWVKAKYPKVNWTSDTKWVVDGNLWTAAGAVAGMDMTAHWMAEKYGKEVMTLATSNLDFEPRDVNGEQNVLPKRYDSEGKQISTHVFEYHNFE